PQPSRSRAPSSTPDVPANVLDDDAPSFHFHHDSECALMPVSAAYSAAVSLQSFQLYGVRPFHFATFGMLTSGRDLYTGLRGNRSTMTELFPRAGALLRPLAARVLAIVAQSDVVLADETSMPMLSTVRLEKKPKRTYLW